MTATLRSDPWGTLLRSSGTLPDWRFQGSWSDTATDLAYARARWYSPALGSFISEDTLLGSPETPASRHLLAYAEGDPANGWDPEGKAPQGWSLLTVKYRALSHRNTLIVGGLAAVICYPLGFVGTVVCFFATFPLTISNHVLFAREALYYGKSIARIVRTVSQQNLHGEWENSYAHGTSVTIKTPAGCGKKCAEVMAGWRSPYEYNIVCAPWGNSGISTYRW